MEWTEEARASLKRVPFFVRPLVRRRAERRARERGLTRITIELMRELREKEHTGPR